MEIPVLRELGLIVVAAAAVVLLGRAVRVPPIVAYMVAGVALGPVLGVVTAAERLEFIATFGIALLLFVVGLELRFERIRDIGRVAVAAGLGQILFTALGGFGVSLLLGYPALEAFFIGTALTFSSTVVVVKLLNEKKELGTLYGRIAVGIFLVQDLVVVIVLTIMAGLIGSGEAGSTTIAVDLVRAFLGMGLILVVALAAARWILPRVMRWFAASLEALFIVSLFWCLLFVLLAERLELSLEIGAFIAGVSLAQLPFNDELRRRTRPLMNFCIAVFFVSLGTRIDLTAGVASIIPATVLSLFVLVGKTLIFLWIITRLGYGERTAFLSSVTVAQISEFSFVFAAAGLNAGFIDEASLAVIGMVGFVTIGVSAYMILYSRPLYAWVRRRGLLRWLRAGVLEGEDVAVERAGHVVVVGVNALSRRIVDALVERGVDVLAIDTDPQKLSELPCATMIGNIDHLAVLHEAGVRGARLVVSTLQIEDVNRLLAYRCRELGVPVAIHAFDQAVVGDLEELGVDYLIATKSEAVRMIAAELARAGVL